MKKTQLRTCPTAVFFPQDCRSMYKNEYNRKVTLQTLTISIDTHLDGIMMNIIQYTLPFNPSHSTNLSGPWSSKSPFKPLSILLSSARDLKCWKTTQNSQRRVLISLVLGNWEYCMCIVSYQFNLCSPILWNFLF